MRLRNIFLLIAGLSFSSLALAGQISENFSSRAYFSSATANWNQARGLITPSLIVKDWNDGANQSSSLEIGDGSHGEFNSSTWSRFATSVDSGTQTIYLDTTTYPIFKFTTFTLPAGWTIEPVGSNPLIIYVQGDMILLGTIECSGKNGTSSTGTGATATAGAGGEGRCGGARGGNGGSRYTGAGTGDGQIGVSTSGLIGGGAPGVVTGVTGTGGGGGGGGSWTAFVFSHTNSSNGTMATGGARGANHSDPAFTELLGSAGGGGGSGCDTEAGGGGGGGGGLVVLHVGEDLDLGTTGLILANGGNGGASPSAGGAGGSGAGGSVQTWVAGTLSMMHPSDYQIRAFSGTRGNATTGGDGGSAWAGRTWTVSSVFDSDPGNATGTIFPSAEAAFFEGSLEYSTSAQTVISSSFDTFSTLPSFTGVSLSQNGLASDILLEAAGSNDGFVSDDTGWVSEGNISSLNNKRYLRFRITLTNTNATSPTTVDSLSFDYTSGERKDFDFKSSGCGHLNASGGGAGSGLALLCFPLLLAFILRRKLKPICVSN